LLEGVVRNQLAVLDARLAALGKEEARLKKAKAFLESVRYRAEARPEEGAIGWTLGTTGW
jgi:hypothetical protein